MLQHGWTARTPILLVLPLAACAAMTSQQEYTALQEDVRILRRDVAALSRSTEGSRAFGEERLARVETELRGKVDQLLASLKEDAQRLSQSQGDLSAKIGEFSSENRITQGRVEETAHRLGETNQRIDALEVAVRRLTELATQKPAAALAPVPPGPRGPQTGGPGAGVPPGTAPGLPAQPIPPSPQTAAPAPAPPAAPGAPPAAAPAPPAAALAATPDEVYKAALNDYTKGSYDLAINGFKTYLQLFPKTSLVGNAQYWLGESYYSQGKYPEAIREFEVVVKNHADSNKVPSAMLKQGYAYLELKETARGTAVLRELMNRYKNSREARLAQERLRQVQ